MSTAIAVTSPEMVLPPPDRQTPSAHVLTHPDQQPLDAAIDETRLLLDRCGYLVVVAPHSAPQVLRRRLHTVRAILGSDRIALVHSELPPLGLSLLVRQLRQLSVTDFSPGVLASAVRLLAHYIHAGALLNSVAKLEHIPVSLTSHARSWVPGSQFAVLAAPKPQLIKLGGPDRLKGPEYATRLTVAAGRITSDWPTETLAPQWQVGGLEQADLPPESVRWWGTAKLIEFAAAIPDISVLYQVVSSVQRTNCHWCGLQLIGDRCAFCTAPVPSSTGQPGRAPGGPATLARGRPDRAALGPGGTSQSSVYGHA